MLFCEPGSGFWLLEGGGPGFCALGAGFFAARFGGFEAGFVFLLVDIAKLEYIEFNSSVN